MSALRDPKQLQLAIAGACQCPPSSLPSISLLLRLTLSSTALEKKPYSLETSRLITLHRTRLSEIDRARILKQKRSAASKAAASATASGGVKKKSTNADHTKTCEKASCSRAESCHHEEGVPRSCETPSSARVHALRQHPDPERSGQAQNDGAF